MKQWSGNLEDKMIVNAVVNLTFACLMLSHSLNAAPVTQTDKVTTDQDNQSNASFNSKNIEVINYCATQLKSFKAQVDFLNDDYRDVDNDILMLKQNLVSRYNQLLNTYNMDYEKNSRALSLSPIGNNISIKDYKANALNTLYQSCVQDLQNLNQLSPEIDDLKNKILISQIRNDAGKRKFYKERVKHDPQLKNMLRKILQPYPELMRAIF